MNDRFGDICPSWDNESNISSCKDADEEMGNVRTRMMAASTQPSMKQFFRRVESVKEDIDAIKKGTKVIDELLHDQALQAITTKQEKESRNKLRSSVDQTNQRAKHAKTLLGLLKEETKKAQAKGTIKKKNVRVRENICNNLTCRFIDEMNAYQRAQLKYTVDMKKKIIRQVKFVDNDATDEEIDAIMHSEGGLEGLYRERILSHTTNDQLKQSYIEITEKHQDIVALEQSMAELHQMFVDMALLTEHQGEQLDNIKFQLNQAGDYTDEGNVNLYKAIQLQRKIRKKKWWIILIAVVAIVVFIGVLL